MRVSGRDGFHFSVPHGKQMEVGKYFHFPWSQLLPSSVALPFREAREFPTRFGKSCQKIDPSNL